MAEINLSKYGIKDVVEIVRNPSYEELFKEETNMTPKKYRNMYYGTHWKGNDEESE